MVIILSYNYDCDQTVGRIKIKLGMQVGLGPGHTVPDRDPASLPKRGAHPPIFDPCLLCPNGWMDQLPLGTTVGLRPGNIVLDADPDPSQGVQPPPKFQPMSVVAKRLDGSRCHS